MSFIQLFNPWSDMTDTVPYMARVDKKILANKQDQLQKIGLRLDAFPEPFIGNPDTADIVLLVLNPGFIEEDVTVNFRNQAWVEHARKNLTHDTDFFYLRDNVSETGGHKWWRKRLNALNQSGVAWDYLAQKVMCIEYFPYHSVSYKVDKDFLLPSQKYSFHMVGQAIERNKTIVIMRSKHLWMKAVPELSNYPFLELDSPQSTYVTPDNMNGVSNDRPSDYNKILQILTRESRV